MRIRDGMRGFERRDDAFDAAAVVKAASASSSVIVTYSARPVSLSHACSGPTPG
jgi:hypothetical protein